MFVIETEIQRKICGVDVYAALLKTDGRDMAHTKKNEWGVRMVTYWCVSGNILKRGEVYNVTMEGNEAYGDCFVQLEIKHLNICSEKTIM